MPERMEWVVRVMPLPEPEVDDEGEPEVVTVLCGDWEPFTISEDYLILRKQVMIESDDKSSAHHELSFAERYER
jgi:hypothetical protein